MSLKTLVVQKMEKLSLKQLKFTTHYLETGNATEAAMQVYKPKNRNTAHSIGSENLRKPAIRAYLDDKATNAVSMVYKLSQKAKNEAVRLNASRDILDRAGYFVNKTIVAEVEYRESPEFELRREAEELREEMRDKLKSLRESKE